MRTCWLALCWLLLAARPLHAWDRENHMAIIDAAFILSPAAAERIPAGHRSAFREEAEEPDPNDRECRDHRGPDARAHPAVEAESIYRALTASSSTLSPYQRARSIGRFVHFVADSAVPNSIADGGASSIAGFWGNRDFVLFRERQSLGMPLATSLRQRGAVAQWADDSPSAGLAAFRLAVNLTIDALLLLPAASGSLGAADAGPVGFIVNRIDNGLSARNSQYWYVAETSRVGNSYFHKDYIAESTSGGDGPRQADLMSRRGVQLVEWIQKVEGPTAEVRAILFNNSPSSSCAITLGSGGWSKPLDLTLGPDSLYPVALRAPAGLVVEKVKVSFAGSGCSRASEGRGGIPASPRLVVGAISSAPRFDRNDSARTTSAGVRETPTPKPSFGSTVTIVPEKKNALASKADPSRVSLSPSVERALAGRLSISSIKVRRQGATFTFRATVKNLGSSPIGRIVLHIRVLSDIPSVAKAIWSVALNMNELPPQTGGEFDAATLQEASERPASFELVEVTGL